MLCPRAHQSPVSPLMSLALGPTKRCLTLFIHGPSTDMFCARWLRRLQRPTRHTDDTDTHALSATRLSDQPCRRVKGTPSCLGATELSKVYQRPGPDSTSGYRPSIAHQRLRLSPGDRLPGETLSFITASDTVFSGTTYTAQDKDYMRFPSHLGMNCETTRGPGGLYPRRPLTEGRWWSPISLVCNISAESINDLARKYRGHDARIPHMDVAGGDILYLTEDAENLVSPEAHQLMPLQKTLTTIHITGYTLGTSPERSPYSPQIRLLAEEAHRAALLSKIELRSQSIVTFTWVMSAELNITLGHVVIMDIAPLVGVPAHRHMASSKPTTASARGRCPAHTVLPDRRGRTRSRCARAGAARRRHGRLRPPRADAGTAPRAAMRRLGSRCGAPVACGGDAPQEAALDRGRDRAGTRVRWVIHFVLATAEPDVLVPLVETAFDTNPGDVHLAVDVFSRAQVDVPEVDARIVFWRHVGRMPRVFFEPAVVDGQEV
ncbi:hypothetical protein B0H10DRAFT_2444762 [Mycena sp. CBHHK59/15]|nr:hypothetical protein B0H10DRAFT_2444762 [Mycena sp. CBHHK59/15]